MPANNTIHVVLLPIARDLLMDATLALGTVRCPSYLKSLFQRDLTTTFLSPTGASQWISTTGMCARCKTLVATDPNTMFESAVMPRVPM